MNLTAYINGIPSEEVLEKQIEDLKKYFHKCI